MTHNLKIEGMGKVVVSPDMMRLNYELVQTGNSYADVFHSLKKQYTIVIEAFKNVGLNTAFIKTSSIDVEMDEESTKKTQFRARQRLIYEDRVDLNRLTKLLDGLQETDNFNFSLSYFVKDPTPHLNDALILAINESTDKSKIIAESSGIRLGHITSIEYTNNNYAPVMHRAVAMDSYGELNVDDIIFTQTVTMSWEIK